jgi:hypothetical protein
LFGATSNKTKQDKTKLNQKEARVQNKTKYKMTKNK